MEMWFILACVVAVIAFLFWMEMPKASEEQKLPQSEFQGVQPPNYRYIEDPIAALVASCLCCKYYYRMDNESFNKGRRAGDKQHYCRKYGVYVHDKNCCNGIELKEENIN